MDLAPIFSIIILALATIILVVTVYFFQKVHDWKATQISQRPTRRETASPPTTKPTVPVHPKPETPQPAEAAIYKAPAPKTTPGTPAQTPQALPETTEADDQPTQSNLFLEYTETGLIPVRLPRQKETPEAPKEQPRDEEEDESPRWL